jgi:Fic family protein
MFQLPLFFSKAAKKQFSAKQIQRRALYPFAKSKNIELLVNKAITLKHEIDSKKQMANVNFQGVIQEKMNYLWTYHSNAIEGSRLSLEDTIFFLQEKLTVSGKPFKDFMDTRNHAEAINFLYSIIPNKINESSLKKMNKILLAGAIPTRIQSFNPGKYKKTPNYTIQSHGVLHNYVEPQLVPYEMDRLIQYINNNITIEHPIIVASIAHYNMVKIHPFEDGNGRGARLLMNWIFLKQGYSPAVIKFEEKNKYFSSLKKADAMEINPFIELVAESLIETQALILSEMKRDLLNRNVPTI